MAMLRERDRQLITPEDICTHLGDDYERWMGSVNPPIFETTLFGTDYSGPDRYFYTRMANPTTEVAERKIAALEGADGALCFGSGMGAITSAIMHYVRKDCHIIIVDTSYCDAREFVEEYLVEKSGVQYTLVKGNSVEEIESAIRSNTTLIYLESPSSEVFRMQDLEKIAKIAKAKGIGTVIDNTYATPLHQQPLKWGIDISVHTVSKYLCGHSNVVGGVVCAREEIIESIRKGERKLYGSLLGPMESYLLSMGMRTLPLRMRQHGQNGLAVAEFLENHPKVLKVFYPGSKTYEQKELFDKYMTGTNGLLTFMPKAKSEEIIKFVSSLKHFIRGVSWGGFESLACGKAVGDGVEEHGPRNAVRLHIGLEDVNTLIEDIDQALNSMN